MKFYVNDQHGFQNIWGELVVVPVFSSDFNGSGDESSESFAELNEVFANDGGIMRLARSQSFEGENGAMLRYFTDGSIQAQHVMLLGLGEEDKVTSSSLQEALAAMFKKVKGMKLSEITLDLRPLLDDDRFEAAPLGELVGSLAGFIDHNPLSFKTREKPEQRPSLDTLRVMVEGDHRSGVKKGLYAGRSLAEGMNLTRNLVDMPAGHLRPSQMLEAAGTVAAQSDGKITMNYYMPDQLKKMGAGALLGVAQGSSEPAILIDLEYTPPSGPTKECLCLIGKTVTFDTGGVNLKSAAGMLTMKRDMSGGATVLGALKAIAALEVPVSVRVIMAAAENMTGDDAYRPGDVLESMSGLTIEIGNTDAEGRLTMADAIEYAKRKNVSCIVDFATLTGAVISIGGDVAAACFGNNNNFANRFAEIARCQGEPMYNMEMLPEFRGLNNSDIADVKNTGGRLAGSMTAAWFLREFAGEETPWIHVDIAGTAYRDREVGFCPKGASAYGVRTAVALAWEFARDKAIIR